MRHFLFRRSAISRSFCAIGNFISYRTKREEGIPKSGEALAKGIPYLFKSHESCWNPCARFLCGGFGIPSEGEDKFVIFSMERAQLPAHVPPASAACSIEDQVYAIGRMRVPSTVLSLSG